MNRIVKLSLSLFIAYLLTFSSLSYATHMDQTFSCITSADVLERTFNYFPTATIEIDWSNPKASSFMDHYNLIPPASSYVADRIMVLTLEGQPLMHLIGFHEDCLIFYAPKVPTSDLEKIRGWATGIGA